MRWRVTRGVARKRSRRSPGNGIKREPRRRPASASEATDDRRRAREERGTRTTITFLHGEAGRRRKASVIDTLHFTSNSSSSPPTREAPSGNLEGLPLAVGDIRARRRRCVLDRAAADVVRGRGGGSARRGCAPLSAARRGRAQLFDVVLLARPRRGPARRARLRAGKTAAHKLDELQETLAHQGLDGLIITAVDCVN